MKRIRSVLLGAALVMSSVLVFGAAPASTTNAPRIQGIPGCGVGQADACAGGQHVHFCYDAKPHKGKDCDGSRPFDVSFRD
jgi:hypothetical protein